MDAETPSSEPAETGGLNAALRRNIRVLDLYREHERARRPRSERISDAITRFTGSMAFVYLHIVIYGLWILANVGLIPGVPAFDPTFVILASEASVEAIFLSTFVLISQNRMAALADVRADLDLHINLLTEHELTKLTVLVSHIADRLGVESTADPEIDEIKRDVEPVRVLEELEGRHEDGPA